MLVNDKDALARVNSPLNLLNKLRERSNNASKAMSLFVPSAVKTGNNNEPAVPTINNPFHKDSPSESSNNPFHKPSDSSNSNDSAAVKTAENVNVETLLDGAESKIKLAHAHNNALELMNSAIDQLKIQVGDVKPEKLPSVIAAASKVVEGIRKERNEAAKSAGNRSVHLHFYTPQQRKLEEYNVIDVG